MTTIQNMIHLVQNIMTFDHYISPILLTIPKLQVGSFMFGPLEIRYYGVFVVIALILGIITWKKILNNNQQKFDQLFDLMTWMIVGGTIGARLGHVFFYEWDYYAQNLTEILKIYNGGLASHGLTIGLATTFFIYLKIKKIKASELIDLAIIPVPFIVIFVRLANFLNSEIVGRPTGGEWGVRFHFFERDAVLRHPSQLYEALLGVIVLILVIWSYRKFNQKLHKPFVTFSIFLLSYFSTRFLVEFFKEYQTLNPSNPFTMGQYLSIPLIIIGGYVLYWALRQHTKKTA